MFIEMAEHLACPAPHESHAYCVLAPDEVVDRMVWKGIVACPVCRTEYPIDHGVVRFGKPPQVDPASVPDGGAVQALLELSGPGGYVVLVGSASRLASDLGERQTGVHMVTVNAPPTERAGRASHLEAATSIPLRRGMARGVVVGQEMARGAWATEAGRVLSRGRRFVALDEVELPDGIGLLATGDGLTVGEKRAPI